MPSQKRARLMTVKELKAVLQTEGLSVSGSKKVLLNRYLGSLAAGGHDRADDGSSSSGAVSNSEGHTKSNSRGSERRTSARAPSILSFSTLDPPGLDATLDTNTPRFPESSGQAIRTASPLPATQPHAPKTASNEVAGEKSKASEVTPKAATVLGQIGQDFRNGVRIKPVLQLVLGRIRAIVLIVVGKRTWG